MAAASRRPCSFRWRGRHSLEKIKGVYESSDVMITLPGGFVALRPLPALTAAGFDATTQGLGYRARGRACPGESDQGDEAVLREPILLEMKAGQPRQLGGDNS